MTRCVDRRVTIWVRRLGVMTQKELLHLGRDLPLLLFLIYSFTLSVYISATGVTMQLRNAALLVYDEDHSESSRDLIHRFQRPYFSLRGEITDPVVGLRRLDRGTAMPLLTVPPRFHEMLQAGEQPSLQLLVDTSNAAQGLSLAGYAMRIVGQFGAEARILEKASAENVRVVHGREQVGLKLSALAQR